MKRALVTGASGFIGRHLVDHLLAQGTHVRCLVRPESDRSAIARDNVELFEGSLRDQDSLRAAVAGIDVVFHLAGVTKALRNRTLWDVNEQGTRRLAQACAEAENPPTLLAVSSLAAAGPLVKMKAGEQVIESHQVNKYRVRRESDPPAPVSNYGRSKLAGEQAMMPFADRVPMTIVRPPIVLGAADRDGLEMFRTVARLGLHFVPGWRPGLFSVIHVEDLVHAMTALALNGQRCEPRSAPGASPSDLSSNDGEPSSQGIYFAGDTTILTYAELGKMIGKALGTETVRCIRVPPRVVLASGLVNQGISYLRRRPHILGIDKAREATAKGWACDPAKLLADDAVEFPVDLQTRLNQTAAWYREHGWL